MCLIADKTPETLTQKYERLKSKLTLILCSLLQPQSLPLGVCALCYLCVESIRKKQGLERVPFKRQRERERGPFKREREKERERELFEKRTDFFFF